MKSIRAYLLSRLMGGTALILALAGLAVYAVVVHALETQFDQNLSDRVQGFASILFQTRESLSFEFSDELMPEFEPGERANYFELRLEDGRLVESSNSLGERQLELAFEPTDTPRHWTAKLPDGRAGRYVAQTIEVHHVYPEEGPERPDAARVRVVIARGVEGLVRTELRLLASCLGLSLLLIGLIACLSWRAVARGLEPAERLAAALDAIRVDELPAGLDVGALPEELQPVAAKTDALIRRVDTALARERRTAADIAHELRTPIAELLTVSEVALRARRGHKGHEHTRRALSTIRDVAWRMGGSVSTLLKLARLELDATLFARQPIDMAALVTRELRSLSAVTARRNLTIENLVPTGATVQGDDEALRIIVANLLGNALYYAPPPSRITCRFEGADRDPSSPGWRFVLENPAGDLTSDDLPVLSSPFWKKDRARSDRDRSGLGLALSSALAERTGMVLSFELEDGLFRAALAGRADQQADSPSVNGREPVRE